MPLAACSCATLEPPVRRCKMHAHDFKIYTSLDDMKDPPKSLEKHDFFKNRTAISKDDILIDTSPPPPRDTPPSGAGDIELRSPTRRDRQNHETKQSSETKNPL